MRKSCRMGSSKPDRGSTPRRQGAKGFAENKNPRRGSRQGFLKFLVLSSLFLVEAATRLIHHSLFSIHHSSPASAQGKCKRAQAKQGARARLGDKHGQLDVVPGDKQLDGFDAFKAADVGEV